MVKWIQLLVTGVTVGSIYSLIALGYVTIYRTSRIVNMAQGAFVMFGAFFTYSFLSELGLPYWLSAILGILGVVIVAIVMYLLVLGRSSRSPWSRSSSPPWPSASCSRTWPWSLGGLREERAGLHR